MNPAINPNQIVDLKNALQMNLEMNPRNNIYYMRSMYIVNLRNMLRRYNSEHGFYRKRQTRHTSYISINNSQFDRLLDICIEPHQIKSLAIYLGIESQLDFTNIDPVYPTSENNHVHFIAEFAKTTFVHHNDDCTEIFGHYFNEKFDNTSSLSDPDFTKLADLCHTKQQFNDIVQLFLFVEVQNCHSRFHDFYFLHKIESTLRSVGSTVFEYLTHWGGF